MPDPPLPRYVTDAVRRHSQGHRVISCRSQADSHDVLRQLQPQHCVAFPTSELCVCLYVCLSIYIYIYRQTDTQTDRHIVEQ